MLLDMARICRRFADHLHARRRVSEMGKTAWCAIAVENRDRPVLALDCLVVGAPGCQTGYL